MRKHNKKFWFGLLTLATVASGWVLWNQKDYRIVVAGKKPIIVEIADTDNLRIKGLSNRGELESGHGMLFMLKKGDAGCMWMKEMHFNIDVYWFNKNGSLVDSEINLKPSTYPKIYCPLTKAYYVLEVNSGELLETPSKLLF